MSAITQVTSSTFREQVLDARGPVLVDLFAPWCGPCRILAPILERVAARLGDRARIVKVNVDEEPEIAAALEVRAVPTLALFLDGRLVHVIPGLVPEGALVALLEGVSGKAA